uniref:Uncharacterized protein n=1 Tax=Anguilla anguilla TaxID=7936 RepID=A0A0E9XLD2_ANGAN
MVLVIPSVQLFVVLFKLSLLKYLGICYGAGQGFE